jgi:hypothetical protein
MSTRLPPSLALFVVGLLLVSGGSFVIVGLLLFAPPWFEELPLCLLLGAAMLLAGIGLCRALAWGWYLAFVIAGTGLAVVVWRLHENGAAEWPLLCGALVTDVVIMLILLQASPEAINARHSGH